MEDFNNTAVKEFILLAFSRFPELQVLIFIVVLVMCMISVLGNLSIIVLVKTEHSLHTPMYFFISVFAGLEILFMSVTIPKLLANLVADYKNIAFIECFAQLYAFNAFGVTECCLLAVMAFDRNLAINNPLRYGAIMNPRLCLMLAAIPWVGGFVIGIIPIIFTADLDFCASKEVNHFFCDLAALQNLSCSDPIISNVATSIITVFAGLAPFMLIIGLYIHIIITISRIRNVDGKKKAFSTCSSHLIVASLFYGTVILMYIRPSFSDLDKFIALIYTVLIPFLNPFIYTLRNKDVKEAFKKFIFPKHNFKETSN
ncbi:olfactory receptor 5V1-like [Xenopus tropicalis]|uniref:Olfactory receptor 5V1-like n=1 Tax=Xenopus tropicalis TaxID=8364 RepID=A0A8J0QU56_XENTR|nr:olfactory receptor 5V1-like [Xenopus tropicalis]